jgi:hypothetical protein
VEFYGRKLKMHIYEYLFTAIIIVLILFSSSTMITIFSEPARSTSEKEQLKVAAQKLAAQVLLDPGDPLDWGSNLKVTVDSLKAFGLAKYGEVGDAYSRDAYVLDADKVARLSLSRDNPLYVSPSAVINLLNLGFEFGFTFEILPALAVNISRTPNPNQYEVSVTSQYAEMPIAGADVTAKIYYYSNSEISCTEVESNITRYDGKCIIAFSSLIGNAVEKVLTLVVDYYGIRVCKVFAETAKEARIVANQLFTQENVDLSKGVTQILVNKKGSGYAIEDVTSILSQDYVLEYIEPSAICMLAISEDGNLLYASKEAALTYSSTPNMESYPPFTYSIERSVLISGSLYIFRLYVWRMSW